MIAWFGGSGSSYRIQETPGPLVGLEFAEVSQSSDWGEEGAGESAPAIEWLGRVLASDGLTGGENRFLGRLERLLRG